MNMRPADRACLAIALGVSAYELTALRRPDWELITHAVARYRLRWPWLVDGLIVFLAVHLLGRWPTRLDPLHQIAELLDCTITH